MNCCQCKFNCSGIAVIASIIVGVIAAFLTFSGNIAISTYLLWAFFGIGLSFLALTLTVMGLKDYDCTECICPPLATMLAGVFGTIAMSLVLLLVDVAVATVVGAILYGLLFLFFTLLITSVACIIKCFTGCK